MNITAAELPDRLRQMARNGLTETMSGRRAIPPDGAASVVEFAADILELRDRRIAVLTGMLRTANELVCSLAEGIAEMSADNPVVIERCNRLKEAVQKTNLALEPLERQQ